MPEGISLTPEGVLVGVHDARKFAYTVAVEDSARPANRISKDLQTVVSASGAGMVSPPQARGDRIDGAVQVSSTTDDFDLTFIIVAINEIGRATALGYQHFTLKRAPQIQIPFGQTLPHRLTFHADAVAEFPEEQDPATAIGNPCASTRHAGALKELEGEAAAEDLRRCW